MPYTPREAADCLTELGHPTTDQTVRRWCKEHAFGYQLFGRWRIPDGNVEELVNKLRNPGGEVPGCRASNT